MNMKTLNIEMYGGMKDFFAPQTAINTQGLTKLSDLIQHLKNSNPQALELISKCAIAVNGAIVKDDVLISDINSLAILPPYSGG